MKKSLLAVAVLGAFAGSALAADVTLYGVVDEGLVYTHIDPDVKGAKKTNDFQLKSGVQAGSRWGLKGTEDLGNGYKVGFILESGFTADDGVMAGYKDSTLFNREASLSVSGPFGKVMAGKIGSPLASTGSIAKMSSLSAFGTTYTDYSAGTQSTMAVDSVRSNSLVYETPVFAGFQGTAFYSMGKSVENKSRGISTDGKDKTLAERYAAVAVTYKNGPVAALFGVDRIFYDNDDLANKNDDDSLTVTLGGSYDFGVAKVFAGAQYFDEVKLSSFKTITAAEKDGYVIQKTSAKVKGYGLNLSTSVPALGGTALAGVSYLDAEAADSYKDANDGAKLDVKRIRASVGYAYPLSKRTLVYGAVVFGMDEYKNDSTKQKPEYAGATIGLRHNF